jgi:hypothetical protein
MNTIRRLLFRKSCQNVNVCPTCDKSSHPDLSCEECLVLRTVCLCDACEFNRKNEFDKKPTVRCCKCRNLTYYYVGFLRVCHDIEPTLYRYIPGEAYVIKRCRYNSHYDWYCVDCYHEHSTSHMTCQLCGEKKTFTDKKFIFFSNFKF